MKVALVHDWLTGTRGGEKVLLELVRLFPGATIFTLFHFPGTVPAEIEACEIRTTFLQKLVARERNYRTLLPLFFAGAETWDFRGFDLVLSSSHCVAKNARAPHGALHVSYCHTPVRYLHDQFDEYFRARSLPVRAAARLVRGPLRTIDVVTSGRVDAFLANSRNVAERIARLYGRESLVVHPPVDTEFYTPAREPFPRSGLVVVSALAPYKRVDDAIALANAKGVPLTIAGFGPEEERLRKLAGPSVRFAGVPTDAELRELYRGAAAVLMPGEEDFGIVPVEAQACGAPVLALGRGGALETVVDGVTGVLTKEPGPAALADGLARLRSLRFESGVLAAHAAGFSRERFRERLRGALSTTFDRMKRSQ